MRWLAVSGIMVTFFAGTGQPSACTNPCGQQVGIWWDTPLFLLLVLGGVWLWRWWFSEPPCIGFAPDDPEKIAATQEARRTLRQFWHAFDHPAPDESDFAVKFNLTPHKDAEFIWAYDLKRESGRIYGRLGNEPFEPGYTQDHFYEINPDLIVDWTYYKGTVAQGHYMTQLMFKHMPQRFVRRASKALGWA
jgi:uncharacterized protein YegJ (DUF2314 family)